MPKIVTKIAPKPKLAQQIKVAAYARVSTGKDAMLHSLSSQVSYYSKLIQGHEGWQYVGVYADCRHALWTKPQKPVNSRFSRLFTGFFVSMYIYGCTLS